MATNKEAVLKTAEKLVAKNKLDAAIKEYKKVLRKSGDDINILNRIGDLYAKQNKNEDAIEYYRQTAGRYAEDGFYVKAIALYKKIQRIEPGLIDVHHQLAELYVRQGLVNDARSHYQHLADHYQRRNEAASAIGIYQKMLEMEPDNPSHHLKLAELYRRQKLNPQAIVEYGIIAELMVRHGQFDQAVQVYVRTLELDPNDLEFVRRAVTTLSESGNPAAAHEVLQASVQRNPAAQELSGLIAGSPAPTIPPSPVSPPSGTGAQPVVSPPAGTGAQPVVSPPSGTDFQPVGGPPPAHETLVPNDPAAAPGPPSEPLPSVPTAPDLTAGPVAPGPVAPVPAPASPTPQAETAPPAMDGGGSQYEEFVLDLEDDEAPSTLVAPPPDMLQQAPPVEVADAADIQLDLQPAPQESGSHDFTFSPTPELGDEEIELELTDSQLQPSVSPPMPTDSQAFVSAAETAGRVSPAPAPSAPEVVPPQAPSGGIGDTTGSQAAGLGTASQPAMDTGFQERFTPPEPSVRPEDDLLAEAEVFVKYGLAEKAIDRLREVLSLNPGHLAAHGQLIALYVEQQAHELVPPLASSMAAIARQSGVLEPWSETRSVLMGAGYAFNEDLLVSTPTGSGAPVPQAAEGEPSPPASPELMEPLMDLSEIGAEVGAALGDPNPGGATGQPPPPAFPGPALGEPAAELALQGPSEAESPSDGDSLFDDAEELFDLAEALQDDLGGVAAEEAGTEEAREPREQTLEEIVEGFKKGVAENLSPEDSDTHYNLGIAYKEMTLLDEAIGEFQIAAKDPAYLVDSCVMLGQCFSEKDRPKLALEWYRQALESPNLPEAQRLGTLYEVGQLYVTLNDREAAYQAFVEIYGINTSYRDVVTKLQELQPSNTS